MKLSSYLELVAKQMDGMTNKYFNNSSGELVKASAHLLAAGGKRLRPAAVLLSADAIRKGKSLDVIPAAFALELAHTFTLVHDDIIDGDKYRRGVLTVHNNWDIPTGILAGDALYSKAFEFIQQANADEKAKVDAILMLARACYDICEGQYLDMSFEKRNDVSEKEYIDMATKKTGVLTAAAAGIGAKLAGGDDNLVNALYKFGLNCGIASQIQDDLIDLYAKTEDSGKDRASDLREGKQTIISIKARKHGIDLSPYRRDLSENEIDSVIKILENAGVIEEVRKIATDLVDDNYHLLDALHPSPEQQLLKDIGTYVITRNF